MQQLRFIYWEEDNAWLGYLEETLDDLREHLKD